MVLASLLSVALLTVTDITGVERHIPELGIKATTLIYVGVDCPIANRMAPEIARVAKSYAPRGVQTIVVYPDRSLKAKQVKEHLASYSIEAIAVIDKSHLLVKTFKPSVTPQAIVVDKSGKVRYSGRINDLYEEHGKIKAKATRNDLRVALDELLAGKKVSQPVTQTVGCFISDD